MPSTSSMSLRRRTPEVSELLSIQWTAIKANGKSPTRYLGRDTIRGNAGNDIIRGGGWLDTVDGGEGEDRCGIVTGETRINCERGVFGA